MGDSRVITMNPLKWAEIFKMRQELKSVLVNHVKLCDRVRRLEDLIKNKELRK